MSQRWRASGPGIADAHRAGHVRAVPVDDAAEVDHDELVRRDLPVRRPRVRLGAVRARRDDRVEAHRRSRRVRASRTRAASAKSRSVGASRSVGQDVGQRVVGDRARGLDPGDLTGVLHHPEVLDQMLGRARARRPGTSRPNVALLRPRHPVGLEPEARRSPARSRPQDLASARPACVPTPMCGVAPVAGELLGRLVPVAAVGHERARPSAVTRSIARGAGEPGEVPDVRQAGDEQRVDPGVGEALAQSRNASARRPSAGGSARSRSTSVVTASRPRPRPRGGTRSGRSRRRSRSRTGATTDLRRHSSRADGFERCSSTFTPSYAGERVGDRVRRVRERARVHHDRDASTTRARGSRR